MVIFFSPFWLAVLLEFRGVREAEVLALLLPAQGTGAFGGAGGGSGLLGGSRGLRAEALDKPPGGPARSLPT